MSDLILIIVSTGALSGIGGAVFVKWIEVYQEKKKSKKSYVKEQLDKLYGPLFSILSYSYQCIEIMRDIHHAHNRYFGSGEGWSQAQHTQESLQSDSKNTLDTANEYGRLVASNSHEIFEIIKLNYAYMDLDDIDIFNSSMKSLARLTVEFFDKKGLPYLINKIIGEIEFFPKKLQERVEEKFYCKKNELMLHHETLFPNIKEKINYFYNLCKKKWQAIKFNTFKYDIFSKE